MFSATAATFALPGGQRDPLVQVDELRQREQRMAGIALDLGLARHVTEHEEVRRGAVDQPERDAGVRGMGDGSLSLDEQQRAAALVTFDDEPLGGAGDEVGDDRVDGDPPARDRDSRLAGRDEARLDPARPRRPLELERDGHLPDRAVRADREHDLRRDRQVRARGDVEVVRRAAQVAQLDAVARRQLGQLRIVGQELVQPVLEVQALRDAALQELAPGRREPPALGRDPDHRRRRPEAEGVVHRRDDRHAGLRLPRARRVEERHDLPFPVREHAAGGLPVVRRRPRSPRRGAAAAQARSTPRLSTPNPGRSEGT